jgi:sulfide:quinone oxidoreductase
VDVSGRVVVAGSGIAGVEALLGLRELVPGAELVLVSPAHEFLHQSLSDVASSMGGMTRYPLERICADLGAERITDVVLEVDAGAGKLVTRGHGELGYDAVLVAAGARRVMSLDHALLFGSTLDVPAVESLLGLVRGGQARRLAVVVPASVAWSLPAYEVALQAADAGGEAVVIADEDPPAAVFGDAAGAVAEALDAAGVERVAGRAVDIEPGCVLLANGTRVAADAIVALPWARGPRIEGLPTDERGFIAVDEFGSAGAEGVFAAGDGTTFAIRQGGVAAQQGAVAATSIARHLGAAVEPSPLRPFVRGALPTAQGTLYLEHDLASGTARASYEPLWQPPHRIAGVRLPALLERLDQR